MDMNSLEDDLLFGAEYKIKNPFVQAKDRER